nr:transcription initiation factor TFIID subunit 15 [Tanacetum cinerariifolium]
MFYEDPYGYNKIINFSIGLLKKDKRTGRPKIWIYRDKVTNEPKGDATVTYEDPYAAQAAVEWFNNKEFNVIMIKVLMAVKKLTKCGRDAAARDTSVAESACQGAYTAKESSTGHNNGAQPAYKSTAGDYKDCGASPMPLTGEPPRGSSQEEDPEEEPEEEEIEDDVEVINPYEEADPHNRPPPTSDKETEFAPPVVQIADADDVLIPPVIQFGSNFHIGESSTTRDLLAGNSEVYAPGPMCCNLKSVHRGVMKL